jgi:hypothetical protein
VSKVGENRAVDCAVVDYDGKPVANQQISLKMVRYLYDRNAGYGHEYRSVDVKATAQGDCEILTRVSHPSPQNQILEDSHNRDF